MNFKLFELFSTKEKRAFFAVAFIVTLSSIADLLVALSFIPLFQALVSGNNTTSETSFLFLQNMNMSTLFVVMLIVILMASALGALANYLILSFSFKFGGQLILKIFKEAVKQPLLFHLREGSNKIISAIHNDVNRVVNGILIPFFYLFSRTLTTLLLSIGLLFVDFWLTLGAALVFCLIYFLFFMKIRKQLVANGKILSENYILINKSVVEAFHGIKEVKSFGLESLFSSYLNREVTKYTDAQTWSNFFSIMPKYFFESLVFIGGISFLYFKSTTSESFLMFVPKLAFLGIAVQKMLPSVQQVFNSYTLIKSNLNSLDIVKSLLPKETNSTEQNLQNVTFDKTLDLENINFFYNESKKTLSNLNLSVKKGETVAVIGPSGSGKSTLLDMLLGLVEPSTGTIRIDGTKTDLNSAKWREKVGYVPQSTFLIDASIAENIAIGSDYDEAKLYQCLEAVDMKSVVMSLPDKHNTRVGERGLNLSGGQRQRLGIARALYRNPEILVLDEATSALDPETESSILNRIFSMMSKKTIFIAAHRLSALKNVEKLFLIQNGEVATAGVFSELVANDKQVKDFFKL